MINALLPTTHPPVRHGIAAAFLACTIVTLIALPLRGFLNPVNLVMLYLLAIVIVASRYDRVASTWAAIASALCFDFFLVEPYYSFAISDIQYAITFAVLLLTGLVISALTSRLAAQSRYFEAKERQTAALYAVARKLASARGRDNMLYIIRSHIEEAYGGTASIWMPVSDELRCLTHPAQSDDLKEKSAAKYAYEQNLPAGLDTTTLPGAHGYYLPLKGTQDVMGVLGFLTSQGEYLHVKPQLEAVAHVAASALERAGIAEHAEKHKVEAEGEKLRNTLLSAVSHDFRTPLAAIKGVISSLMMKDSRVSSADKQDLLASAHSETLRLERIVSNLLEVTILESGRLKLKKDYYFLSELMGNALKQTDPLLHERSISCSIPSDLPPLHVDGLLIEQVFINLLENASKYTPSGSPIIIRSQFYGGQISIAMEDHGPGIPPGEEEAIFDAFHTTASVPRKGSGLGLAICRGILRAHGGEIKAANSQNGAMFMMTLPASQPPITEAE